MERKQIHQQIEIILGKLYQLNKYLLTSEDMLDIEVDLIKTYMAELNRLTALLNTETTIATISPAKPAESESKPVSEIIVEENITAENIVPQPNEAIKEEPHASETKQPEPENASIDEEVKFIKEEIIEPIIKEAEKEFKEVESQVKEVVEQLKSDIENKSLNELFSGGKMELADKFLHHAAGKPLKDFISIGDKFMFISELFNKDLMAYESAIKKLNDTHSFEEAMHYLEEELDKKFHWDKKQEAVKHFKSILKKKFGVTDKS